MKNSKRNIYLTEILIFIYLLLMHFLLIIPFKNSIYLNYINMLIWLFLAIVLIFVHGFIKDNNYYKKLGIRYAVVFCLIYIIIIYILGLFTGFSNSIYSHTIKGLFNNIFPVLIMVISEEITRYIICKKSNNIKQVIIITIIYIIYDLLLISNYYYFDTSEQIFIFLCVEFFPLLARQAMFSYITYKISYIPTLILEITLETFWFIVPFYPNLGNYITSVIGIIFPYLVYLKMSKIVKYREKTEIGKKENISIVIILIFVFNLIIFMLVAGIGKYKMIAIGSNSMNPIYYKGDAIIYEKTSPDLINKTDILVFFSDEKVVTHRVVDIIKVGEKLYFRTKGDNNNSNDVSLVPDDKVYGKVKYIVKYIGYPTIWLQELFNN